MRGVIAPLFMVVVLGCEPPPPPVTRALPRAQRPPSPSYQTLDGRFHYYAVTRLDSIADHFTATFLRVEGAYCTASRRPGREVEVEGCGFPASQMASDEVPADRAFLLPSLRAAVLDRERGATNLHFRFEGAYRSVILEEEVPCEGKHGQGYNSVELRYDAALETLLDIQFRSGSGCGAMPFYWASAEPRWLQFTSTRTLLDPVKPLLDPALAASLLDLFASTAPDVGHSPPAP